MNLKAPMETTEAPTQEVGEVLESLEGTDSVGDDEERIPVAQERPISDYKEITEILDSPLTVTPTRHSKRLSEKRRGQDY